MKNINYPVSVACNGTVKNELKTFKICHKFFVK